MNKADGQPGVGAFGLYRIEIDNAPAGDGAGLLPRITMCGLGAAEGVLICIGALAFSGIGDSAGGAAVPSGTGIGA